MFFFCVLFFFVFFFFSSRRRHTRCLSDWSSDVCSSDLSSAVEAPEATPAATVATVEWAHGGISFKRAEYERLEALGERRALPEGSLLRTTELSVVERGVPGNAGFVWVGATSGVAWSAAA